MDGTQCSHPDWRHAAGYVMSPPLNPDPTTKEKLMKAICAGDIQIVSSVMYDIVAHWLVSAYNRDIYRTTVLFERIKS